MNKIIIIAEAGVNHNGDLNLAFKLVDAAADAGADYIKFQTFITELIVDKSAKRAEYQIANSIDDISQYEMIKKLELSFEDFHKINNYCKKRNIKFLTTVADFVSLKKIDDFNLDFIKVSSGELTNILFLRKVAQKKKPIILSTGMASIGEIEIALNVLYSYGIQNNMITVLHCNTEYPTPMEDVNLKAMLTIADTFKIKTGYSDHTLGIEVPIAAAAMGATVIEKHFTLDKKMDGPDHSSSLEPNELKLMISSIRNIEKALSGSGVKYPSKSESKNIPIVRKSIFAEKEILFNELFTEDNLCLKRPGDGIPASDIDKVLGKTAAFTIAKGSKIKLKDIKW